MIVDRITIAGDTPGQAFALETLRFEGSGDGPSVYMQAALHAQELPGFVAIDALLPRLAAAEAEGRMRGRITIVPHANPIGLATGLFGEGLGRFDPYSRVNYNRAFTLPGEARREEALTPAVDRLKALLLALSADAEIVLDLHCDDEGPVYLYVPDACWPAAEPLAAALGAIAVLTWSGEGGGAFEDAVVRRWLDAAGGGAIGGRVVSTVELRGMADVGAATAEADARGLYGYLVAVGAIADAAHAPAPAWTGLWADQSHVDMIRTPAAGAALYDVAPGERIAAGGRVARIVGAPGRPAHDVRAPREGLVLTRRARRFLRRGDDVAKIVGPGPAAFAGEGPLEP
jgi:predicted deacylase